MKKSSAVSNEQLITALMESGTVKEAAGRCGISERTVYNRLAESDFQAAYKMARADLLRESVKALREKRQAVYEVMDSIMQSTTINPDTRLKAAGMILAAVDQAEEALKEAEQEALKAMDTSGDFLHAARRL